MFYVYILLCKDTSLYVGSTNNLEKRLKEHNTSKNGAHYTKIRLTLFVILQCYRSTYFCIACWAWGGL